MRTSPGLNVFAGDDLVALDNADNEAGKIVFAIGIEAGHFGGFAADEGAAVVLAGIGEAGDNFFGDFRFEFAGGEVVHEEHGRGALHGDVVDAVVDQVAADRVVEVHFEGDFEFGADAVDAGDEHGIEILLLIDRRRDRQSRRSR